ncbi:SDR family oxidoreductase [Marinilabiliaceae bacterium JC017]|nr:SDR family oxidoreductase [Marinilabiliaceae bacterium JC017]
MAHKTVLITGSAKRIGKNLAWYFAEVGYEVVLHYNTSNKEVDLLQQELAERYSDRCFPVVQADLSQWRTMGDVFEGWVNQVGTIDILVNNASIFKPASLMNTSVDLMEEQLSANFLGPFFLSQAFFKNFSGGQIINLLDTKVITNESAHAAYLLAKKALCEFTKMAALEWAPAMRVNAIAPGPVLPAVGKGRDNFEAVVEHTPLKHSVDMSSLNAAVEFLINASSVTGQVIYCDAGMHLKNIS